MSVVRFTSKFVLRIVRRRIFAIFALRQLIEKVTEHDRELNIVFVDKEKAFNRVNMDKL